MGGLDVRRVVARCRVRSDSPLEGDGFELPVPREKGWSFDGSPSSAPFKSLRVSTKTTRFSHEGPMVRIRLPPAASQSELCIGLRRAERPAHPFAKNSCSGSPLIFSKGSTAIGGLSSSGSAGVAVPLKAIGAFWHFVARRPEWTMPS